MVFLITANNFVYNGHTSTKVKDLNMSPDCKIEAEFQYGGCRFSETGSSDISAADNRSTAHLPHTPAVIKSHRIYADLMIDSGHGWV